jgi:hypothetical protein
MCDNRELRKIYTKTSQLTTLRQASFDQEPRASAQLTHLDGESVVVLVISMLRRQRGPVDQELVRIDRSSAARGLFLTRDIPCRVGRNAIEPPVAGWLVRTLGLGRSSAREGYASSPGMIFSAWSEAES